MIELEPEAERERLARSVRTLRAELGSATDVGGKLRRHAPAVAGGAALLGFLRGGGAGALARLAIARRAREHEGGLVVRLRRP
jgi:hypothetical protein